MLECMAIQRLDDVAIVVEDLDAAVAFFTELGMELEGKGQIEGLWADRTVGLDGVRSDIAMMRTPDGHSKLELTKYHTPAAVGAEPENPSPNTLGLHRVMFAVDDIDDTVARLRTHAPNSSARWRSTRASSGSATSAGPRASSSPWPNRSADASLQEGTTLGTGLNRSPQKGQLVISALLNLAQAIEQKTTM
jgi:catechol 2,3-dioxygenase-like lactoylglutathione lyase family enzyme